MDGMTLEKLQVIIEAQTKAYYEELEKAQKQTNSAARAMEKRTEALANGFTKVSKEVGKAQSIIKKELEKVRQQTRTVTDAVEKQTNVMQNAYNKVGKAAKAALSALSIAAIISFGKGCIELGSALSEVQNLVDVTFGSMSGTINRFARDALGQFGLSETSAKKYASTMGSMLKSMGLTTKEAADMSMAMAGLSADMASFYNLDTDTAFEKIRSGISGETEPLKQLGINMGVANLEAYALSQGITKAYNAMTQQEQAMLRYNYLMQATADAQGDFARTSGSWANQVRVLAERFNALKAAIGQGLIAVLTPVIRALNILLGKILTVTDAFRNMIAKITGKNTQVATTVSDIGGAAGAAAGAMGDVGAATDKAGQAAGKAKKQYGGLLSMDEVHSLKKGDGAGPGGPGSPGGGGASGSGLGEDIVAAATETDDTLNPVLERLLARLKELQELFRSGFRAGLGDVDLSGITKAIDGIRKSLREIFTATEVLASASRFMDALAYALGQGVGALASIGITMATNLLGGIDKYLAQNKGRVKQFIASMFDIGSEIAGILGDLFQAVANIFSAFGGENGQQATANLIGIFANAAMGIHELAAKVRRDVLDLLARPFIDNQGGFKAAIDATLGIVSANSGHIKTIVDGTFSKIHEAYDQHLAPMFDSLATGLSSIAETVLNAYGTYILPVMEGLQEKFGEVMEGHIQPAIGKGMEYIGKIADAVREIWEQVLLPFINWFITSVFPYMADGWSRVGNAFLTVAGIIADVVGNIFEALGGIVDFIVGVFTLDWERAWEGIKTYYRNLWEAMQVIVQAAWEAMKERVSSKISEISTIISTVLDAVQTVSETVWTSISNTVATIWNAMKSTVSTIINQISAIINTVLNTIKTIFENIWNAIKTLINTVWNEMKALISTAANDIKAVISNMLNAIKKTFSDIWDAIKGIIEDAWNAIERTVSTAIDNVSRTVSNVLENIKSNWGDVWDAISTKASSVWEAISTAISGAIGNVKDGISTALENIKSNWGGVWDAISTKASSVWEAISTAISGAIGNVKDGISTALENIRSNWGDVWGGMKETVSGIFIGIWDSIKGTINSIIGGVERMANGVIVGINGMIRALNKLSFDVPSWVPEIGGSTFGFNIPTIGTISIPRLARGGVVDKTTLAMIGENGREAVVPLENNTGWMDHVASRLGEILSVNLRAVVSDMDAGDGWQTIHTTVVLDSKTLVEQTDRYRRRKGYQMAGA